MTIKAINEKMEVQTIIHETARQIVELIAAAKSRIDKLGGDEEEAEQTIVELVTEE